jgi:hypothetical protein
MLHSPSLQETESVEAGFIWMTRHQTPARKRAGRTEELRAGLEQGSYIQSVLLFQALTTRSHIDPYKLSKEELEANGKGLLAEMLMFREKPNTGISMTEA